MDQHARRTERRNVIFLQVTPGYVEKAIDGAMGKPNVTGAEAVFGRHDVAIRGQFHDLAELHRLQSTLGVDFVRGFQAYPAVQEFVKVQTNGRAAVGWVLVRTNDPQRVAAEIKKVPGVEGLIGTVGNFELLARIGAEEPSALMTIVFRKIQTINL